MLLSNYTDEFNGAMTAIVEFLLFGGECDHTIFHGINSVIFANFGASTWHDLASSLTYDNISSDGFLPAKKLHAKAFGF